MPNRGTLSPDLTHFQDHPMNTQTIPDNYMNQRGRMIGSPDRGDGHSDMQHDPPRCPDRALWGGTCGGDAYWGDTVNRYDPEGLIRCSDCDNTWNAQGEEIDDPATTRTN